MNHIGILSNALRTTMRHRALWVLGFIWALVGGCGAPRGNAGGGPTLSWRPGGEPLDLSTIHLLGRSFDEVNLVGLIAALLAGLLVVAIVLTVIRYVLRAGVLRLLDAHHRRGTALRVQAGFREGWHRRTWHLLFQNIVVDVPFAVAAIATLLLSIAPALLLFAESDAVEIVGVVSAVVLFFGWLAAVIVARAVLETLKQLWWRAAVVGGEDFLAALGTGWRLARANARDVVLMLLLMVGARLVWAAVVLASIIVLIVVTGGLAVLPAYLMYAADRPLWAALYGVPVALLTFVAPLVLAGGLYLVFEASVWAQVYSALGGPAENTA